MKRQDFSYLAKVLLLFLLYLTTARLGLQLDAVSGFATLFWLPTGISLAFLFLFGYRLWPGVALGAFFANLLSGAPFLVASGIALGNTLEALLGVYLLRRIEFHRSLERVSDVLGLVVLAAALSTLVSASIGVLSLFLGGVLSSSFLSTWIAWWMGDMLSNIIAAPILFVWSRPFRSEFVQKRVIEVGLLAISVIVVGVFVFRGLFGIEIKNTPLTYLVFPPLIWAALRFGPKEAVTATFLLSLLAVWGTASGHGPFAHESLSESLLFLQSFMGVTAVTTMLLAAAVAERRELEKRKDDLISFASHELKTPLTSIKVFTELLKKTLSQKKEKQALQYLSRMSEQVNKLMYLINDMLDVSKVQTGKLELEREWFSLHKLVKEIVSTMQTTAEHSIVLKANAFRSIYGDRARIGQVITNLLSNAIKYSPDGKTITATIKRSQDTIVVSVEDRGIGIAKKHQAKIFDRFYRVTESGAETFPGFGIGLYLSHVIIKQHGGEMWVKSKPMKGSTFYFSLPVV